MAGPGIVFITHISPAVLLPCSDPSQPPEALKALAAFCRPTVSRRFLMFLRAVRIFAITILILLPVYPQAVNTAAQEKANGLAPAPVPSAPADLIMTSARYPRAPVQIDAPDVFYSVAAGLLSYASGICGARIILVLL